MEDDVKNTIANGATRIGPNRYVIKRTPAQGVHYFEIFNERGRKLCTLTVDEIEALRLMS